MDKRKWKIKDKKISKQSQYKFYNQHGITLIALVITIIIMVILAGVSLNATIGENGIISKAQYSTFLSEMTDVEEALKTWQTSRALNDDDYDKKAPTNGLCTPEELQQTKGLMGEVGYYRVWSISASKPTLDLTESSESFDNKYESEFIYYPAGVQDLYYLNNETLGINKKKKYLIDASTGIIYSVKGANLKGIQCYSLAMAKTVMEGYTDMPSFAELEISTGKNAGNVSNKYKVDENGNYILDGDGNKVENPDYNPYGFEIISSVNSDNVYKLYNNGDLYAKGVKGAQINTPTSKMEAISNKWTELTIPEEIGEYKQIISGSNTMYVIDQNDYLWAWGNNSENKLGLTQEQQVEYTGRDAIKLNVDGKKVKSVYEAYGYLFVVTIDNKLYAMGSNIYYFLGLGHNNEISEFKEVSFPKPDKISYIVRTCETHSVIIACTDGTFYSSGRSAIATAGLSSSTSTYKKFVQVFNGYTYVENSETGEYTVDNSIGYKANQDIDSDIKQIVCCDAGGYMILKKDGTIWHVGYKSWNSPDISTNALTQYSGEYATNVKNIYSLGYGFLIEKENGEIYAANGVSSCFGAGQTSMAVIKLELPSKLVQSGIKQIYTLHGSAVYYLSNDNVLFASSTSGVYIGEDSKPSGIVEVSAPVAFTNLYAETDKYHFQPISMCSGNYGTQLFLGEDGKLYTIGDTTIMYRNNILEKSWQKIASNVEKITLCGGNTLCYIEKDTRDLYVAGDDTSFLDQHTDVVGKIANLTKLDDTLINGKVKDIQYGYGVLYILTTDKILYATGTYSNDGTTGWPNDNWPGWSELSNCYELKQILTDVTYVGAGDSYRIAISNVEIYGWGSDVNSALTVMSRTPIKFNISAIEDPSKIKKILCQHTFIAILTTDNQLICSGASSWVVSGYNPAVTLEGAEGTFKLMDESYINLSEDENVIDIAMNGACVVALTNKGNVYGLGVNAYLGNGTSSNNRYRKFIKLKISNVASITAGNNFLICIKNDGSVYGTGTNQYGILGRWIGVDRKTPNSRYKTAFDWVECPELEI